MHTFATIFVLLAAGFAVYWFMVRPILRQWSTFKGLYDTLDRVEATLWFRIKMSLKGLRTILLARFLVIAPVLLFVLDFVGSIDVAVWLPPKYMPYAPLILALVGFMNERLRRASTTPAEMPVMSEDAVVEVPTVSGVPDVAVVSAGPDVVAVVDMVKAHGVTAATTTEPVTVAEVVRAVETEQPVVVKAKE